MSKLDEAQAQGLHELGGRRFKAGDFVAAEHFHRRALELHPDWPEALLDLGGALKDQARYPEAAECYRRALELRPDFWQARYMLVCCEIYGDRLSPAEIAAELRAVGRVLEGAVVAPFRNWHCTRDPERKLRIGYIGPDFHEHPVATFLEPLLANHDRDRLEVCAFVHLPRPDGVSKRLHALVDHWRPIHGESDAAVAQVIRALEIDVLIDLAGHTANGRLGVLAHRPAPVQASWCGWAYPTGFASVGYRIVDEVTDPDPSAGLPEGQTYATTPGEDLLRLPGGFLCWRPPDYAGDVMPPPSLQRGFVTFGSFNFGGKLSPACLRAWGEILRRVPSSRLHLKALDLATIQNRERILVTLEAAGVERGRVTIQQPTRSREEHLAAYDQVDIALDPWPYNGTTTTVESLWMGVFPICLAGDRHAARVGASLLAQLGIRAAATVDEYVAQAVQGAERALAEPAKFTAIRLGLRDEFARSPLCDGKRFAREFEDALRGAFGRWCRS